MSGHGSDGPSGGDVAGALAVARVRAQRSFERTEAPTTAYLPVALAFAFLVALPVPGLVDLLDGASLALLTMLAAMPIWYVAARARNNPFDPVATRAIFVVLACAGFLIFWSLISTFGAEAPSRASRYIATLIAAFAIYFLVRSTITRERVAQYVDVLAAGLAATSALSLLGYEIDGLRDIIFGDTDRAAGFFKNPNQFGMAISTTVPAVMALFVAERERRRFRAVCLVLMLLGLVASGSKTNFLLAWVSILAVLCGHAWIAHTGARRYGMLALSVLGSVGFAGLGVVALSFFNPRALAIMLDFFGGDGEVDSLLTRSFLWVYSLDQFLADPILGQGAGQRIDIFYRAADVSHSHNVLLDYMRTLGVPGLLGVSLMIGTVVIVSLLTIGRALRAASGPPAARLLCLGLALNCLCYVAANMSSDSFGPSTSPFFWLFAYLTFAARNLMRPLPAVVIPRRRKSARRSNLKRFPDLVPQAAFDTDHEPVEEAKQHGHVLWLILAVVVFFVAVAAF